MIVWMLARVAKSPHSVFRRDELLRISPRMFDHLKRIGLLVYVRPGAIGLSHCCPFSDCGNVCPMDVIRMKGQYYAVCPEDDSVGRMLLTEDDLARYRFSLDVLAGLIRQDNGLGGSAYRITPRLYFLGNRLVERRATAFVLACFPSARAAEPHLLSLPARLPGHCAARAVVLTPSLDLEHRQRYSQLRDRLRPALRDRDGERFIECDRSKGYRLSTHPDFVISIKRRA